MIKDITKQEALSLLSSGKEVWVLNEATRTFVPLLDAINGTLIADVEPTDIIRDDEQSEEVSEKTKKRGRPRKEPVKKAEPLDVGKIGACYKAGCSMAKIADEMNVTSATVLYHLRKLGLKEDKE